MSWSSIELIGTDLGDERFRKNAVSLLDRISEKGDLSLSSCLGERLRKSCYNLTSKKDINLLEGHIAQSVKRSEQEEEILVLTDTSDLNYNTHFQKKGMGQLGGRYKASGICLHNTLAVTKQGVPLGIINQYSWAPSNSGRQMNSAFYPIEEKESYKWLISLKAVNKIYKHIECKVLVVSDREADFYEYLSHEREANVNLLVRGNNLRRKIKLEDRQIKVGDLPSIFKKAGHIEVEISQQKGRPARQARVDIRFGCFTYPVTYKKKGKDLKIYFVHAKEDSTVKGSIEWFLFSTRPIQDFEQAVSLVEHYSKRWVIERFHYTLKTGLGVEKLQIDQYDRLVKTINLYSIAAWRILRLKYLVKNNPNAKVEQYCEKTNINILSAVSGKQLDTVEEFVLAMASLVGFKSTKKQPYPGEKILWQSYHVLANMRKGWHFAINYGTG